MPTRLKGTLPRALTSVLFESRTSRRCWTQTDYTQPALFALEYALAAMWRSWGVEPAWYWDTVCGEYVAACVAGVLSLDEALHLSRNAAADAVAAGGGVMAAVHADEHAVRMAVEREAADVAIAAFTLRAIWWISESGPPSSAC